MRITLLTGKTFDIAKELGFEIKVIKSTHAKRLTLRIDSKERIPVLSLPPRCSGAKAVDFVNEHLDWIEKTLAKIPQAENFAEGETISLMGKEYTITHVPSARRGVYIEENKICISGDKNFLHRRLKDYIKKTAQKEFLKTSQEKAARIGCHVNSVSIKDTKSRWGSCSTLDNINYNWRVALAPDFVIEYLIAHEVAHLKHQDHSKSFWQCVKNLYPRSSEGRLWLKTRGKELYRYS